MGHHTRLDSQGVLRTGCFSGHSRHLQGVGSVSLSLACKECGSPGCCLEHARGTTLLLARRHRVLRDTGPKGALRQG